MEITRIKKELPFISNYNLYIEQDNIILEISIIYSLGNDNNKKCQIHDCIQ